MSDARNSAAGSDALRWLPLSLLLLRLGVVVVMLVWSVDKLLRPEHAAAVFGAFYGLPGLGPSVFYLLGGLQLLIVLAFAAGLWRAWTYGAILVMHLVSTLSSFRQYLAPFDDGNLLFFAAWPMLAACLALFLLREADTFLTMSPRRTR